MAYAPQVKKDKMDVVIWTDKEKIEGTIFKLPDTRLLDMLNKNPEPFIPVSDANVYSLATGALNFQSSFLAVNKDRVVLITESYTIPNT
jgi:hypothetical protein